MEENKNLIWAYRSTRRQNLDNDYYFYEDGTILHHYDCTMAKCDIEEYVLPSEISDFEKVKILERCKMECNEDVFIQINAMLDL